MFWNLFISLSIKRIYLEKPDTLSKSQNKKTKIVLDREDVRCYNKNMKENLSLLSDILGSYSGSNDEHLFQCPYCKHHKRKSR